MAGAAPSARALLAASLLAVLRLPTGVCGISCYECSSQQEAACADPFSASAAGGSSAVSNSSAGRGLWRGAVECSPEEEDGPRAALHLVITQLTRLGQAPELPPPTSLPPPPQAEQLSAQSSTCIKLHFTVMGQRVTARDCAGPVVGMSHPCNSYKLIATSDIRLDYCGVCYTDGCNRQSQLRAPATAALLALCACWISLH